MVPRLANSRRPGSWIVASLSTRDEPRSRAGPNRRLPCGIEALSKLALSTFYALFASRHGILCEPEPTRSEIAHEIVEWMIGLE